MESTAAAAAADVQQQVLQRADPHCYDIDGNAHLASVLQVVNHFWVEGKVERKMKKARREVEKKGEGRRERRERERERERERGKKKMKGII